MFIISNFMDTFVHFLYFVLETAKKLIILKQDIKIVVWIG